MENSSNNNWLNLLRKKIQKKFKRNRQKVNNAEEVNENVQADENNQNTEETHSAEQESSQIETTAATNNTEAANSLSHNCEEMKKELFKLNWYWPNLR